MAGNRYGSLVLLEAVTDLLRWGWVVSEATLLALLISRKLVRRYPLFFVFLIVEWVQMAALIGLDTSSTLYAKCWAVSEVLLLFALAFASVEVTKRILEYYPRVREMATNSFLMIFSFGFAIATVMLVPNLNNSVWQPAQTYFVFKVLRWESLALCSFLIAQAFWFNVFPIRMRRNVVLHRWLLALYGGAVPGSWVVLYDLFDRDKGARGWINLSMMAIQICLVLTWCIWFNQKGEEETVDSDSSATATALGISNPLEARRDADITARGHDTAIEHFPH